MASIVEPPLPEPRYTYGGDEFIFCEVDEAMSFGANFKALAVCQELARRDVEGVVEICPANASYLVRLNPDVVQPHALLAQLKEIGASVDPAHATFKTRVIDVPAYYDDPWTREVLMRFRDHHQKPDGTDLEYVAEVNGFASEQEFIEAHHGAPYYVSMVGFVPGLPWCFQMVAPERQLEVPKYLRPRTDTPKQTVGYGGCFSCIYSVRGAGGYQMFGITPAPIYDPTQSLPDFADFMVFFRPADIVKFTPIDRDRYDAYLAEVEAGTFRITARPVEFSLQPFLDDPDGYNTRLLEVLR
jgi:urea carboxylase